MELKQVKPSDIHDRTNYDSVGIRQLRKLSLTMQANQQMTIKEPEIQKYSNFESLITF